MKSGEKRRKWRKVRFYVSEGKVERIKVCRAIFTSGKNITLANWKMFDSLFCCKVVQ